AGVWAGGATALSLLGWAMAYAGLRVRPTNAPLYPLGAAIAARTCVRRALRGGRGRWKGREERAEGRTAAGRWRGLRAGGGGAGRRVRARAGHRRAAGWPGVRARPPDHPEMVRAWGSGAPPPGSLRELHLHPVRDDPGLVAAVQEQLHRSP